MAALRQALCSSQSSLSRHLARLREDGPVTTRRVSQAIFYSLANVRVPRVIELLNDIYCAAECEGDPLPRPASTVKAKRP